LGLIACTVARGGDGNKKAVPLDQVPQVVKDAALKAVDGIKLTEAEMKTKDSLVVYELEGVVGDKKYEIKIAADGNVLKAELDDDQGDKDDGDQMDLGQVPQVVTDAAAANLPGFTATKAELEVKGGVSVYELSGTAADGKTYEIKISAAGQVLKAKLDDDDNEDGEKENDEGEEDDD